MTKRSDGGFAIALHESTSSGLVWRGVWWDQAGSSGVRYDNTIAYVTKRSDGGFAVAVFEGTSSGLVWRGVWWDVAGTSGVQYGNTKFVSVDANGDGWLDLYYATSTNWNANGFAVALMQTGITGFTWAGVQWAPSDLKLGETRFLPGAWVGDSRQEFAYVTRRPDGGFAVAVFEGTSSGLVWRGVWWDVAGTSGVQYANTTFLPADMDADTSTDLYYATAADWSTNGFAVALMHNSGGSFSWWNVQWVPTDIKLLETRLLSQH